MGATSTPMEIFNAHVFDLDKMKNYMPQEAFKKLVNAIEGGTQLDDDVAEAAACAMREWALSMGATHYTHWFQPRTEATAEKHMAFLSYDDDAKPFYSFSGKQLISSEPDASSFPSGGMRSTFEARGYCAWDPSSPAFLLMSHKGGTLCIPSVFISYDGTPLDMKTPLIKSIDAVTNQALRLLKMFGNRSVKSVQVTVGAEQEYFLLDADTAARRPDLTICSRALIGQPSPKAQNVEAHYFGSIHPRILSFMEDVERDMYRLGTVIMTRHNEAAPCQFEFAPLPSEANRGCDQNHMLMEAMRRMARRHGLKLIFHEKPFNGTNGSGKHLNFSLRDSEGRNLLKPSSNRARNIQFLTFLSAFLIGMARNGSLLRASIASAGNMHRLGGHEAPPAIMTAYLGSFLTDVLNRIASGGDDLQESEADHLLDLGLTRLPQLAGDSTDRNRTSPVAFTGNKWEFRGVGAPQALAGPLTACLALWAEGLDAMATVISNRMSDGATVQEAALSAIRLAADESEACRFDGNGYAADWPEKARQRGLPVKETTIEALDSYLEPANLALLSKLGIMDEREVRAYHAIRVEQYVQSLTVEVSVLITMMREGVLPAVARQISLLQSARPGVSAAPKRVQAKWDDESEKLAACWADIAEQTDALEALKARLPGLPALEAADVLTDQALPIMEELRWLANFAESRVSADLWPYPTTRELFSATATTPQQARQ